MPNRIELVRAGEAPQGSLSDFLLESFGKTKGVGSCSTMVTVCIAAPRIALALVEAQRVVGYCGFIPTRISLDGKPTVGDLVDGPGDPPGVFEARGLQRSLR